ncbi:MAG: REP-associated tyrosine transposase [Candidatus Atribacteria bacterium]|nr:REP-associated tyrosine transposase [Candidatus Atribacteria bacterium]
MKKVEGQLYLGSKAFADEIKKLLPDEEITAEVPKAQRYLIRPSLEEVFSSPVDTSEEELMYRAWVQYNYTLQQIAEYKGVHYTTVSRKIKKFAGKKEM